jgi:hypothetical protein
MTLGNAHLKVESWLKEGNYLVKIVILAQIVISLNVGWMGFAKERKWMNIVKIIMNVELGYTVMMAIV